MSIFDDPPTSTVLTREVLDAAIKKVTEASVQPHGSEKNPHLAHPRDPGVCMVCGWIAPGAQR